MSDLIDPSGFPVPETLTYALDAVAAKLKTDGTDLTDTTADITGAWGGLQGIYTAPEDQDLFTVLNPLTGDAEDVSGALSSASGALIDFAEKVRDIKARWATLKTDSYAFLSSIDYGNKEDWDEGSGFLWWKEESENVTKHNDLLDRAAGLMHEFEEAERTCANAITGLFGGTTFIAQRADGSVTAGDGEFVYGFDAPLEGIAMEWGAPQTTDHAWYNDVGDAVGDFFVGIAEDVGGMVGAHGPDGWFAGNWGDNLWEYWGGTVEGLGALVGVGKDENGEWGFSWETAGNAWKDAAHAVVPWEEWGERPWYVIGTAALNIGATVGGALLTATGVGAVVGVPLMAWRGANIVNAVGGSRTPDVPDLSEFPGGIDPSVLARVPRFGDGSITPVDLSDLADLDLSPADLGRMTDALERLNAAGTPDLPDGDGRRTTGDGSDGDTGSDAEPTGDTGSVPRGTTNTNTDPEPENDNRRNGDSGSEETVDPTADQLDAGADFLDGVDPESRRDLAEGLDGEQNRWVASQVPDDAAALDDTPVDRFEADHERVEVDSAGNEIDARDDGTFDNSVDGATGLDGPRGGTTVVDADTGSGRGGNGGSDGSDRGHHGADGGGLPERPDGDLTPDGDLAPDRTDGADGPDGERPEHVQRAGGSEGDNNPSANLEEGPGFFDSQGDHIEVGRRDETGTYFDDEGNRYIDVPESAEALERYNEIRADDGDVDRISENTGFDPDVIDEIKQHLFFREHPDVPVPPDGTTQRSGRFAPMDHIADLWRKAEAGTLDASEAAHFRRLVMHEYVEARLMDEGVPYRSRDPQLWSDDTYTPDPDRNGAHDIAPREGGPNAFNLWEKWGIPSPDPDFRISDDLSNLDGYVDSALDWWRDRNPYDGAANRPSFEHTQRLDAGDPGFPGENQRFGTGANGAEVRLDPDTLYRVEGRGVFITDSDGRITHVETRAGTDTQGNPELVYPRPNATYYVDSPRTGGQLVYETDARSRTVSIEGELRPGRESRNNEQTAIGHEGRNYFEEYNARDDAEYVYDTSTWQGGHVVASNFFAGPGERINIIPMLKSLNHTGGGATFLQNWGRLEYLWNGILSGDDGRLGRAYSTEYAEGQPGGKPALIDHWRDLAGDNPSITFRVELKYDDSLPDFDREKFQARQENLNSYADRYDRDRPTEMDTLGAPPGEIVVDWSLNGEDQAMLVYDNHPTRTPVN
ncbi:DNA/RNA non-specific endonuclease [Nocardiopsis sp. NPDC055824]